MTTARPTISIQKILGLAGEYGPETTAAVKAYQTTLGAYADGDWGPATERAYAAFLAPTLIDALAATISYYARPLSSILRSAGVAVWGEDAYNSICDIQRTIGATADGVWGRGTENAYVRFRAKEEAQIRGLSTDRLPLIEVARAARAAGFVGTGLINAVAVAIAESGSYRDGVWACDPVARLVNFGARRTVDRGTWQINDYWHGEVIDWKCDTPALAAKEAYRISGQGSNWNPWSTWVNGSAQKHIARATAAVAALG